ncbi:hypothetical protein Hokovirus_3_168 [Hokovirus HKV1]|uniref:Uncharacterized protein n=1 Tax=Hokovirus HKV1 TaxID=1977638 RepID=A0A1V0SGP7_9VIRU|nr:hypothetical protein Hokovirus_3_168 [Hokovirus HKV1]
MSQGPVKCQDVKMNQIIIPNFISSYKIKDSNGKVKEEKTKQLLSYIGYISNNNKLVIPTGTINLDVHGIPSEKYCKDYFSDIVKYCELPLDEETTNGKYLLDFFTKLTKIAKSKDTIEKLFNNSGVSKDELKDLVFSDIIHKKDVEEIKEKYNKNNKPIPDDLENQKYVKVPYIRANFAYDGKNKTIFSVRDPKYKPDHPDYIRDFEITEQNSNERLHEIIPYGSQVQLLLMIQNFWSPVSINKKKGEKRTYGITIKIVKIVSTLKEKSQNNNDMYKDYMFEDDDNQNDQDQEQDDQEQDQDDQDQDQDDQDDQEQNESDEEIIEDDEQIEEEEEEVIEEPTPPPKTTKNVKPPVKATKAPVKNSTKKH